MYPEPWRARYEAEVRTLLSDAGVRWRDAADLLRGLAVERVRALVEPGDHPRLTVVVIGVAHGVAGLALGLAAYGAGHLLRSLVAPPSRLPALVGLLMIICAVIATGRQILSWTTAHPDAHGKGERPPRPRGAAWWLLLTCGGGALVSWGDPSTTPSSVIVYAFVMTALLGPPARWQRAQAAVMQIAGARHEMKWMRLELARCQRLVRDGQPAPLAEAQARIREIDARRAGAQETLHAMGYRARFPVADGTPASTRSDPAQ